MPQAKAYYDIYEPSQRQRLRRDSCLKDETLSGAYCVKKCNPGYIQEGEQPPRCRSVQPLPPNSLPATVVRKQTGVQPVPPKPDTPAPVKPGA